jgi:hypothetical protein
MLFLKKNYTILFRTNKKSRALVNYKKKLVQKQINENKKEKSKKKLYVIGFSRQILMWISLRTY